MWILLFIENDEIHIAETYRDVQRAWTGWLRHVGDVTKAATLLGYEDIMGTVHNKVYSMKYVPV